MASCEEATMLLVEPGGRVDDVASTRKTRAPHVRYVAFTLVGAAACALLAVAGVMTGALPGVAAAALGSVAPGNLLQPGGGGAPRSTDEETAKADRARASRVALRTAARRARLGFDTVDLGADADDDDASPMDIVLAETTSMDETSFDDAEDSEASVASDPVESVAAPASVPETPAPAMTVATPETEPVVATVPTSDEPIKEASITAATAAGTKADEKADETKVDPAAETKANAPAVETKADLAETKIEPAAATQAAPETQATRALPADTKVEASDTKAEAKAAEVVTTAEAVTTPTQPPPKTTAIPPVPHSPEETELFNAEERLRAAANAKAAYDAAARLARKESENAAAASTAAHAEFERLTSEAREAEKEARQATDDLKDAAASTTKAAAVAFENRMAFATTKAEKKSAAAHAKLDDDQSVSRIAMHTKQLNFLKDELARMLAAKNAADAAHVEAEQAAQYASLDAINAKTAAKADVAVGQETTQLGQERASRVAILSAQSKQKEAQLMQAAYTQSDASAKHAAASRKVEEEREALDDELALELLLAAKSRKAEQDFIDATSKHAASETQTAAEGRRAESSLFAFAVLDADKSSNYEKAKRVVDRAQEVAEFKYQAETAAGEVSRDLADKHDIANAAYEAQKAAVTIKEKTWAQAEDAAYEKGKPGGEPVGGGGLPEDVVGDTQTAESRSMADPTAVQAE